MVQLIEEKMSANRENNIKILLERLGSLKITDKVSRSMNNYTNKISNALEQTYEHVQAIVPKSMVPDPGQFDGNRMKFEDWWREIRLFLKSNKVIEANDRIIAILAYLREGIAGIYIQKKLDELDKEIGTQDWDDFV